MKKKYITCALMLLSSPAIYANNLYDHLCGFNVNWKKYPGKVPTDFPQNLPSGNRLVQTHLTYVLSVLRSNSTQSLTAGQMQSRTRLIQILDEYRLAGNFPINYHRKERLPVFIDEHNTHCAVGYLMLQSGHECLAQRIAATDNYVWVKDLEDPEVIRWQINSGFTFEELKLIQGVYDSYLDNAWLLPNKYEIPQKPECITRYFENDRHVVPGGLNIVRINSQAQETQPNKADHKKSKDVWYHGEGKNGVLHGRWEQNYAAGMPWIIGYFDNGKKTGQWAEYYQGTNKLCRTEVWRDDKLNGTRKRFDMNGNITEEILFKDGAVVTKTNYEPGTQIKYLRVLVDSQTVFTQIMTTEGSLIAYGNEIIHNPGNLRWFQNIELTALNSIHLQSQVQSPNSQNSINSYNGNGPFRSNVNLYNQPQLVTYIKTGDWKYYKEFRPVTLEDKNMLISDHFPVLWKHFGIYEILKQYLQDQVAPDSLLVHYQQNNPLLINTWSNNSELFTRITFLPKVELRITRHHRNYKVAAPSRISSIGTCNAKGEKIGLWSYYSNFGTLYKTENYLIPWKDEEIEKMTIR